MGLKLIEFSVKNFRNLEVGKIKIEDKLSIVGINNIGKSNLLKLISVVLHPEKYPSNNDFFSKKDNYTDHTKEIEVNLKFSISNSIFSEARFRKFFKNFIINGYIYIQFKKKWRGESNFFIKGNNGFYNTYPEWLKTHRFEYFNAYLISTEEKNSLEAFDLKNEYSLISDFLKFLETYDPEKYAEFEDKNILAESLSKINFKIPLKNIFPKIGNHRFTYDNLNNRFIIEIEENGVFRDFNHLGSGVKKIFLMNTYFFLFDTLKAQKGQILLLIDEPEVNLHPSAQKLISDLINEISKNQQLIITTHSPYILDDLFNIRDILLLKKNYEEGITKGIKLSESFFNSISEFKVLSELNSLKKEIFFAEKILLVEGYSDYLFVRKLFLEKGILHNYYIVYNGGKNFKTLSLLLNELEIDYLILADYDILYKVENKKRNPNLISTEIEDLLLIKNYEDDELYNLYQNNIGFKNHLKIIEKLNHIDIFIVNIHSSADLESCFCKHYLKKIFLNMVKLELSNLSLSKNYVNELKGDLILDLEYFFKVYDDIKSELVSQKFIEKVKKLSRLKQAILDVDNILSDEYTSENILFLFKKNQIAETKPAISILICNVIDHEYPTRGLDSLFQRILSEK